MIACSILTPHEERRLMLGCENLPSLHSGDPGLETEEQSREQL